MRALSPRETLRRGYSVLQTSTGAVVTSVGGLTPGERLSARVVDGRLDLDLAATRPDTDPATPEETP